MGFCLRTKRKMGFCLRAKGYLYHMVQWLSIQAFCLSCASYLTNREADPSSTIVCEDLCNQAGNNVQYEKAA